MNLGQFLRKGTWGGILVLLAGPTALADLPPVNPSPRPDGTNVWYAGNNTQYPIIEDAVNAASDGDEIVVTGGEYVVSIEIMNNDVTLRPFCLDQIGTLGFSGVWATVDFINPTEGFNNANGYAIKMTGSVNSYIGEPRQIIELPNDLQKVNEVLPGEWQAVPGVAAQQVGRVSVNSSLIVIGGRIGAFSPSAMTFRSRSIDNVAVYSDNGQGTFQSCVFSTSQGYGGGVTLVGDENSTQFINCRTENLISTGNPLVFADGTFGPPVTAVTIIGGKPKFAFCSFDNIVGGDNDYGLFYDVGSATVWQGCEFGSSAMASPNSLGLYAPACKGTYVCMGGTPTFSMCRFQRCESWMGTIYWDSTGVENPDYLSLLSCNFTQCGTADRRYGTVAKVVCDDCGEQAPPRILLSDVGFSRNQDNNSVLGTQWTQFDVDSPFLPKFRIGRALRLTSLNPVADFSEVSSAGDLNGDGEVDTVDLDMLMASLGTCGYDGDRNGVIDIEDVLNVIGGYGLGCP